MYTGAAICIYICESSCEFIVANEPDVHFLPVCTDNETLPEKQPSAINQEQRGINAEWGTNGEGGENFRFARERRVDEKLDEVFFPSTASAISRGTR